MSALKNKITKNCNKETSVEIRRAENFVFDHDFL